jgi:hypothetical protein
LIIIPIGLDNYSNIPWFLCLRAANIRFAALKLMFLDRKPYVSRPQKSFLRQQRYIISSIPQKNQAGIIKKVGKIYFKTSSDSK